MNNYMPDQQLKNSLNNFLWSIPERLTKEILNSIVQALAQRLHNLCDVFCNDSTLVNYKFYVVQRQKSCIKEPYLLVPRRIFVYRRVVAQLTWIEGITATLQRRKHEKNSNHVDTRIHRRI